MDSLVNFFDSISLTPMSMADSESIFCIIGSPFAFTKDMIHDLFIAFDI